MIAFLALLIWLYLFFLHGQFWDSGPELAPATPAEFPDVDIIIPARDEAETITAVIASLTAQDYAGNFRVILVDDNSTDGTANLAGVHSRLTIITGAETQATAGPASSGRSAAGCRRQHRPGPALCRCRYHA
jgi:cellulose synthase/poly-beta-1,6-N-acetylglucosamine synthase-like glycosyltransferase